MEIKEYKLKIKEIIEETDKVKTFRVEIPEAEDIQFFSGQFFMVSIEGDPENLKRAYSIASSPAQKRFLDIALDKVGKFTVKLFEKKPGDVLIFKGPYGKFYFDENTKNDIYLIGGGVGVTPLMSIIKCCNDKKLGNKLKLLYCVRTPKDIIYNEEYDKLKNENKNFEYLLTITRPQDGDGWQGRTGRIDQELLKVNIPEVKDSLFFICGPNEFVKNIIEFLETLGATKDQIKTDVWG